MKMRAGIFLLIALLSGGKLFSQLPVLIVDSTSVQIAPSDSLYFNDTITYSFLITNTGNTVYNGAVMINYEINGSFLQDSIGVGQVIFPGNSISYSRSFLFSPNRYITGDNIVVIWPTGISPATIGDSVTLHVFGLGYNGIRNISTPSAYHLVYDEQMKNIQLIFNPHDSPMAYRIFNVNGELLFQKNNPQSGELPLQNVPTGVYFILVYDNTGGSLAFKIYKN